MIYSTAFILLLGFSISWAADLQAAASKCCSTNDACCLSALKNNTAINCFADDAKAEATAADCIQKELFGSISLRFAAYDDVQCCRIFEFDTNDNADSCQSTCNSVMTTPSFSARQKLNSVKTCRKNNELYTCFRRCQLWLRGQPAGNQVQAAFPINEQCNASSFMVTGRVYLGEQLLR